MCCLNRDDEIVGIGIASVYKKGTLTRCSQWSFGANLHRELWIDHLWTKKDSGCRGKDILKKLEDKLIQHTCERKNIYVLSIEDSSGFYHHEGYHEIDTPHEKDDEDYPSSFSDGSRFWYAKSIAGGIPEYETLTEFDKNWLISSACQRGRLDIIQGVLQSGIFTNYQQLKFFDKFIEDDSLPVLLLEFFKEIEIYKQTFDASKVLKYFTIPIEDVIQNLGNFYLLSR